MPASRVFGYIRVEYPDRTRIERWRSEIARYCEQERLALITVYADNGVSGTEMIRPGLAALLVGLSKVAVDAVVVPSLGHLSDEPVLQEELCARIIGSGAALLVISGENINPEH
jgi:DNA invertase Pin-like site-specific DNA recombinase